MTASRIALFRPRGRRALAAALGLLALVTVLVGATAFVTEPFIHLPLMALVVSAEVVLLAILVRRRMRQYNTASVLELLAPPYRVRKQQERVKVARALTEVERWTSRLNAGFVSESRRVLEDTASNSGNASVVRVTAIAALEEWSARQGSTSVDGHRRTEEFDVVIVSNFNLPGGTTSSNINEILLLTDAGKRVGLIHNPLFGNHADRPVNHKIREIVDERAVQLIEPHASVACDLLLMRFPPFATRLRDDLPSVTAEQKMLVVNQAPMTYYEGGIGRKRVWDVQRVHGNLRSWIGEHRWITVGPLVHDALRRFHARELDEIELSDQYWYPSIDITGWRFRGEDTPGPITKVGRHSRDHASKWPELASELRSCYPERSDVEIHVLGGTEVPKRVLGHLPSNWTAHDFDALDVQEFLQGLDIYVYYTCSSWLEAFGRAPVEAMAAGVPVILPPQFEAVFGSGARYAAPRDVPKLIDELAGDSERYLKQQKLGTDVVARLFSHEAHRERFRSLGLDV